MLRASLVLPIAFVLVVGRQPSALQERVLPQHFQRDASQAGFSLNVSSCPGKSKVSLILRRLSHIRTGYTLTALQNTKTGLTAQLDLAGHACNAFGTDIANLTLEVTYDSDTR